MRPTTKRAAARRHRPIRSSASTVGEVEIQPDVQLAGHVHVPVNVGDTNISENIQSTKCAGHCCVALFREYLPKEEKCHIFCNFLRSCICHLMMSFFLNNICDNGFYTFIILIMMFFNKLSSCLRWPFSIQSFVWFYVEHA